MKLNLCCNITSFINWKWFFAVCFCVPVWRAFTHNMWYPELCCSRSTNSKLNTVRSIELFIILTYIKYSLVRFYSMLYVTSVTVINIEYIACMQQQNCLFVICQVCVVPYNCAEEQVALRSMGFFNFFCFILFHECLFLCSFNYVLCCDHVSRNIKCCAIKLTLIYICCLILFYNIQVYASRCKTLLTWIGIG
jgi:hypothetical protein